MATNRLPLRNDIQSGRREKMNDYKDWFPIKLRRENGAVKVRWGFCGGLRFTEPFFDESVRKYRFPFHKDAQSILVFPTPYSTGVR